MSTLGPLAALECFALGQAMTIIPVWVVIPYEIPISRAITKMTMKKDFITNCCCCCCYYWNMKENETKCRQCKRRNLNFYFKLTCIEANTIEIPVNVTNLKVGKRR